MNAIVVSILSIYVVMLLVFLISIWKKDNSIVDVVWGLGFCLISIVCLFYGKTYSLHQLLALGMVFIWGIRLSAHIAVKNWQQPEDFRYAAWRRQWGKWFYIRSFVQVYMLQGTLLIVNAIPILVVHLSTTCCESLQWYHFIGMGIWLAGFLIETIADFQKYRFKKHHKDQIITSGLWKYSRHPNYFGEALLWWGMFVFSIPSGYWYFAIVSPLLITYLLRFVSGVPMLEENKKGNPEYEQYKKETNVFVPWFRKKN